MNARAIWQGTLNIQKHKIAVKFYSAVVDRQIHFHLLHRQDRARVEQQMVDAETNEPVLLKEARRAFEAEPGLYVEITRDELERSTPDPSREVRISHCVPVHAIDEQLYDHPYYLGPSDSSSSTYFQRPATELESRLFRA
jgi:DNA end-binding protein Ku